MYEGQWLEDLQQGQGVYTLINGNKWAGAFEKGSPVGIGTYTTVDGHVDERKFGEGCIIF